MTTIILSSKGQITLPAKERRELGLQKGDSLEVTYDQQTRSIKLKKPASLDELSQKASSYIEKGTKPLQNVDRFYQTKREVS